MPRNYKIPLSYVSNNFYLLNLLDVIHELCRAQRQTDIIMANAALN